MPDTTRSAAGENLERTARAGYLWCGSTFLLPPLFALAVYAWRIVAPDTPPISLFILLTFTTAPGLLPAMPPWCAGSAAPLDQEGLAEIRQTQSGLASRPGLPRPLCGSGASGSSSSRAPEPQSA
jgi:hypothetical protein